MEILLPVKPLWQAATGKVILTTDEAGGLLGHILITRTLNRHQLQKTAKLVTASKVENRIWLNPILKALSSKR
jgi:hypothetical protein